MRPAAYSYKIPNLKSVESLIYDSQIHSRQSQACNEVFTCGKVCLRFLEQVLRLCHVIPVYRFGDNAPKLYGLGVLDIIQPTVNTLNGKIVASCLVFCPVGDYPGREFRVLDCSAKVYQITAVVYCLVVLVAYLCIPVDYSGAGIVSRKYDIPSAPLNQCINCITDLLSLRALEADVIVRVCYRNFTKHETLVLLHLGVVYPYNILKNLLW